MNGSSLASTSAAKNDFHTTDNATDNIKHHSSRSSRSIDARSDTTRYSLNSTGSPSWKGKGRARDFDGGDIDNDVVAGNPFAYTSPPSPKGSSSYPATPSSSSRAAYSTSASLDLHRANDSPPSSNINHADTGEELTDARRYEEFDTVDWIQDTLFERSRRLREARDAARKANRLARQASYTTSRFRLGNLTSDQVKHWLETLLYATQSWLIFALVGAAIGVNAALIDVVTSWLSDIKFGYCRCVKDTICPRFSTDLRAPQVLVVAKFEILLLGDRSCRLSGRWLARQRVLRGLAILV